MITLLVLQGPDKGRRFELPDEPALVGRDSKALPLTDQTTSRRHCELRPDLATGAWVLKDLGSSNGSYVNGTRVTGSAPLKMGDQVRVGRTLLVFGNQPGVTSRKDRHDFTLAGEEAGMDSAILDVLPSSEDSLVLAVPEPAAAAVSNLKVLYRLSAALGRSFTTDQVLETVMDLVFEHVQADHGIVLLLDEDRVLEPVVVRSRDDAKSQDGKPSPPEEGDGDPPPEPIRASRTIVNHCVDKGEGVLSSNAMADRRFSKGKSVQSMGIRSALCVPIKARKLDARDPAESASEEILGVIYVDSSVRNYTYSVDQLRLLATIGVQAGLAIQNAKLYQAGLQAERLAAIGETTAALSHSIKNILQGLRGGADIVEMGFKRGNTDQARKGWGVVDRNLEKIYNLTMNLLAYSKPREPHRELVHPATLIDECLELVAPMAAEKGVMAVADVHPAQPPVPLDPDGLHQVLMNLLSNALDAVPRGGLIRVGCRYDEAKRETRLSVQDNGPGISPSIRGHLFELFHSTKGNKGTGLGLAVTKKIVDEHDGEIKVRSKPTRGTKFTVVLPAYHLAVGDPSGTHGPGR